MFGERAPGRAGKERMRGGSVVGALDRAFVVGEIFA